MLAALGLLVLASAGFALAACRPLLPKTAGTPAGDSARTGQFVATLIATAAPVPPALTPNRPRPVTYGLGLLLSPVDGRSAPRLLPIAQDLDYARFDKDARVLGDDGRLLWFFTTEIGAFDLRTQKLISTADLRRANPGLGEPWDGGKFELRQRLAFLTRDYRQTYEIDPATLRAEPAAPLDRRYSSAATPLSFLTRGGLLSPSEWFGVHPAADLEGSYKPGQRLPRDPHAPETSAPRRLYRGAIEASLTGPRIASLTPIASQEYLYGAFLRDRRDGELLRLADPEGFLLTYQTSRLDGSLRVVRMDRNGKAQWTADTGIATLQQILPGTPWAFRGTRSQGKDRLPEPVLVLLDATTGAVVTHSLLIK